MVGLVGILKMEESNINICDLLIRMCKVLKHERWLKTNRFTNDIVGLGRVSLGFVNPEIQPIFNEDKSLLIMMEGEIFDYQNVKNELISKGHEFLVNNDPEFILHCYEEYGSKMVDFLNGSFIIALWDKKKAKLILINDRYGARPLYYAFNNGCLLFSSEVKGILEDQTFERIVNDEAVFDFFMRGFLLGDKTFFQGITLLPPASILECVKGNLKLKQYWHIKFNEDYEEYPEEYYVKKLEKLILQAVHRQTYKNHIGLFLSGGLDSRTIAAALHKNKNFKFDTLTIGKNPYCDDSRYAYAISRKLGIPHYFFTMSPDYLASYSEKIVYMTDGMFPCFNVHGISAYDLMRRYCKITLGGTLMDSMFSSLSKSFLNISRKNAIQRIFKWDHINIDEDMIKKLFAKDYYYQNEGLAWKSFKDAIRENECKLSADILSHFWMTQRNRRFIYQGIEFFRNYFERRTPFLDNDLVDFFFTVPPKLKAEVYLYSKTLKKLSPDLVKIPWQKTGMKVFPSRFQVILHRAGQKFLDLLIKLIRKISFYQIDVQNYWKEYHDYDKWIRKNKRVKKYFLSILLDSKTLSRKYFNPNYIKELILRHMKGKANYSKQLTSLLTFELWHREFIDSKSDE